MKIHVLKTTIVAAALAALLLLSGCSHKTAQAPPPPPPAPTAPTAALSASPDVVQQGQSALLTWKTSNANDVTVSGLGTVPAVGSRSIIPSASTTYRLVAKGPGGTADASARITVNIPPPAASQLSDQELFARNVKDVFFDFNQYTVRPEDQTTANSDAQFLLQHPGIKVLVAGHCDDRGSEEYNLGLGDHRAQTIKQYLVSKGISADRIRTISYGKEKPFCNQDDEQCWQSNRRDHFQMQQ